MWLLLTHLAFAEPTAAVHEGTWQTDRMQWQTEWRETPASDTLFFAEPLPQGTVASEGTLLRDDAGRVVGLEFPRPRLGGTLTVTVPQTRDAPVLAVPLLEGTAPQRVVVRGLDFEPADALGLEKHVRYWASPGLDSRSRREFERAWRHAGGRRAHTRDQALYLTADVARAGGLPGRLSPEGSVSAAVQGAVAGAGLLLVLLSAALYRSLEKTARSEANDAYIRSMAGRP